MENWKADSTMFGVKGNAVCVPSITQPAWIIFLIDCFVNITCHVYVAMGPV